MSRWPAVVTVLLLLTGCGSVARVASGAAPSPATASASPSIAATPSASPSPTPATRLSITGTVSATITGAAAAGGCGRTPNGDGADLRFQLNGQAYALSIELGDYHGAGSYPLPPDRVSLHTLSIGPASQFYGSQSGTVSVAAGDSSGTVDAVLAGNSGQVHVSGTWSCAG